MGPSIWSVYEDTEKNWDFSRVWWWTPVSQLLRRQGQEDLKFEANYGKVSKILSQKQSTRLGAWFKR
jgi:hypothetical protein